MPSLYLTGREVGRAKKAKRSDIVQHIDQENSCYQEKQEDKPDVFFFLLPVELSHLVSVFVVVLLLLYGNRALVRNQYRKLR